MPRAVFSGELDRRRPHFSDIAPWSTRWFGMLLSVVSGVGNAPITAFNLNYSGITVLTSATTALPKTQVKAALNVCFSRIWSSATG